MTSLKLGGKDPAYVRPDADLDYTVAQLVDGGSSPQSSTIEFNPAWKAPFLTLVRVVARSRYIA